MLIKILLTILIWDMKPNKESLFREGIIAKDLNDKVQWT